MWARMKEIDPKMKKVLASFELKRRKKSPRKLNPKAR